jgi:hypothetical protein
MLPAKELIGYSSLTPIRRALFTAEFLGIDRFLRHQRQDLAGRKDRNEERSKVLSTAATWPIMVLKDDVKFMIYSSSHLSQIAETGDLLRAYVESRYGQRNPKVTQGLSMMYFQLCHRLEAVDEARRLFDNGALIGKIHVLDSARDMSFVLTIYFDLLFKREFYEEVIDQYDKIAAMYPEPPINLLKLAVASCAKLNTPESYALSARFLQDAADKGGNVLGLPTMIHALLACRRGHAAEALALAERNKFSSIKNNLVVHILVQLGRIGDALDYMEQGFCAGMRLPTEMRAKLHFLKEVVDELKVAAEGDAVMKNRLDQLWANYGNNCTIKDLSLEDFLMKSDSKKRLRSAQRQDAEFLRTNAIQ